MVGHGRSNKSDLQRLVFETRLDKTWEIESHMSHNNLTEELWLPTILLIPVQYPVWVKHRNPLTQILVLTPTIRDFPAVLSPNVQWLPPSNWELHTPQARLDAKACKVGYEKKTRIILSIDDLFQFIATQQKLESWKLWRKLYSIYHLLNVLETLNSIHCLGSI